MLSHHVRPYPPAADIAIMLAAGNEKEILSGGPRNSDTNAAAGLITEGSSSSVTNTPQVSGSTSSRTPEGQRTSEETEPEPLQMSPPLLYTAGPSVERQPRVTHDRSLAGKVSTIFLYSYIRIFLYFHIYTEKG